MKGSTTNQMKRIGKVTQRSRWKGRVIFPQFVSTRGNNVPDLTFRQTKDYYSLGRKGWLEMMRASGTHFSIRNQLISVWLRVQVMWLHAQHLMHSRLQHKYPKEAQKYGNRTGLELYSCPSHYLFSQRPKVCMIHYKCTLSANIQNNDFHVMY